MEINLNTILEYADKKYTHILFGKMSWDKQFWSLHVSEESAVRQMQVEFVSYGGGFSFYVEKIIRHGDDRCAFEEVAEMIGDGIGQAF